jgi:hypothetical protein
MTKDVKRENFDIEALLHPARAFRHPREILQDRDLTVNEKRAILASWASDACAMEAAPQLREIPTGRIVSFDEIMDALRALDGDRDVAGRRYCRLRRRFRGSAADGAASPQ